MFYGASVISWKSGSAQNTELVERLFVSSKAALDGTKPVRGGIPVVFPNFGAPAHPEHAKLAQHGFARSEVWKWGGLVVDSADVVSVRFTLEPTDRIRALYDKPFQLSYVVTLAEHQLSTSLHVTNTSTASAPQSMEFQALLHNYIRAKADEALVRPLRNLTYYDKTRATEEERATGRVEGREAVDVQKFTDSVYEDAPQTYHVTWPGGALALRSENFKDVVVWNPAENGRNIGDMEEEGWKRFLCVEPGYVRGFVKLEAGERWIGQQVLDLTEV